MKAFWNFLKFLLGGKYPGRRRIQSSTAAKIREVWQTQVEPALKTRQPSQLRQAMITADKLVDTALKDVVSGDKMGARLKNAKNLFEWPVYDRIWKAHKVRNSLVHDVNYEPTYFVLEEAISSHKEALEELGISL